jgi:hypothetical protein
MVIGDQHYAPVNTEHVVILFEEPVRPYKVLYRPSAAGLRVKVTLPQDADGCGSTRADAVIVQGVQWDYWQFPKTGGVAIKNTG